MAPTRWNLLVSSLLRPISSPVTNISAQPVTFLRHETSLTSDLGLASSTKYCTATPSATKRRLSASISSRRQRSIGMISCNKFFSNPRCAPFEGEALAVVYGLKSARHFVLGCDNLVVAPDHKPLLGVLNNRHLGDIKNERLLSLKENSLPYRFSIINILGQNQKAPDTISRKPTDDAKKLPLYSDFEESDSIACIERRLRLPEATMTWEPDISADLKEKLAVGAATNLGDIRAVTWADVQEHTLRDENLKNLHKKIKDCFQGITSRLDFAPGIREFFQSKNRLSTVDGVILYNRNVIPSPLRALILDTLHSAQQGVSCMTSGAESIVFWPGITPAIANLRARNRSCNERAPSQPHGPPLAAQEPVYPFQCICADYFQIQGLQLHGGCGPLLWLAHCAAVTRWFFGSCKKTYAKFSSHTALQTSYRQMVDLNSQPRRHNNCCQTGVSITASHLLGLPIQTVAQCSGSRPASACSWTTLARTARSTSTNFEEACFNTNRNTPDSDTGLSPAQMIF